MFLSGIFDELTWIAEFDKLFDFVDSEDPVVEAHVVKKNLAKL
jgi:hypothetical protein